MLFTTDFRRGLKIEIDGIPYEIIEFMHVKPGKGGAFVRSKLRNLLNARVVQQTFRSGEKFEKPDIESVKVQYLYKEGANYVFMDLSNYEQFHITEDQAVGKGGFLKAGMEIKLLLYHGRPLDLELPVTVTLAVTNAESGVKGDTVSNVTKSATLETGITVNVPLFVDVGDIVKIDTRSGEYVSRE
ncbi:Elongation factor P [Desulfovibrionales bacterium]